MGDQVFVNQAKTKTLNGWHQVEAKTEAASDQVEQQLKVLLITLA